MTEIVEREEAAQLVNPSTGEVLHVASAPDQSLAEFLADVREWENAAKESKHVATLEILNRMDRAARWTLRAAGGWILKGQSPEPVEQFDELALREALLELVDQGELDIEAVDRAVEPVVTYKIHKAGVSALRKRGGHIRELIDRYAFQAERRRYVSVQKDGLS